MFHASIVAPAPAKARKSFDQGPRNGPGTRGAENLDRFRERLDDCCLQVSSLSRSAASFRAAADFEWGGLFTSPVSCRRSGH